MARLPGPEPESVTVDGHEVGYLDSGPGEPTLLMVHGNPVSGHIFSKLVHRLPDDYRCVAPDLLGFGRSDKPTDEDDYTLSKHVDVVEEFVQALDLDDVVLVPHDWGGPIGVGAALRAKERYTHLVVLNTLNEAPMKIPSRYWLPFHVLLRLERVADSIVKDRNLFQKVAVSFMDESDQEVYLQANDTPAKRAGIAAFPRMIPYHEDHPEYPVLSEVLAGLEDWEIPALVLFSDGDHVFSVDQGRRLADRMEDARFRVIDGAGHYLQYERPGEIAAAIEGFLGGKG